MARFAPFEPAPKLGVAVSGGADSMCLAILARDWVRAHDGELRCFVVDHALRAESAVEAAQAAEALRLLGIDVDVLRWNHLPIVGGIQRLARDARYSLFDTALARWGSLHLLVAHHADDQAETVMMRGERGSGIVGLSGMATVTERVGCRVLRPLLAWQKVRLVATLEARCLRWIDDPSNLDPRFARARLRQQPKPPSAAPPASWQRRQIEEQATDFFAERGRVSPERKVELDRTMYRTLPADLGRYVLGRCVAAVGERIYLPAGKSLIRLHGRIRGEADGAATLAGCIVRFGQRWIRIRPEERLSLPWRPQNSLAPVPFGDASVVDVDLASPVR